jgi:hypothetical protein
LGLFRSKKTSRAILASVTLICALAWVWWTGESLEQQRAYLRTIHTALRDLAYQHVDNKLAEERAIYYARSGYQEYDHSDVQRWGVTFVDKSTQPDFPILVVNFRLPYPYSRTLKLDPGEMQLLRQFGWDPWYTVEGAGVKKPRK